MKTIRTMCAIVILLIIGAGALAGCGASDPPAGGTEGQHTEESAHGDEDLVQLTPAEAKELGIGVATAAPGTISVTKTFPGEVKINEERYAHVVARVPGVAVSVSASMGERVRAGETMAVLESRELAAVTAAYLAARQRRALADATFEREKRLLEKQISSERQYLEARQGLAEARIEVQAARQALRALGLSEDDIDALPDAPDSARYQYELRAPIGGAVIERHLTRGEAVNADTEAFEIADLSNVWVDLSIYQDDMDVVREGQDVIVSDGSHEEQGTISYVRPIVGEDTRTALARVVLPNPHGRWKPGMFVSGTISVSRAEAAVVIPKSALQTVDGRTSVFVKTDEGFRPRPIVVGEENRKRVAVAEGLTAGEEYAVSGAFTLKAQLAKGTFESGHSH